MAPLSRAVPRRLESALLVAGLALTILVALVHLASTFRTWEARASLGASSPDTGTALTGLLEIPRLGLSAAVAEGDDALTLATSAGHLPDTSVPWRGGNTAIAGHRDQLFRALRTVRTGDRIWLTTPRGAFRYAVTSTSIVAPSDVRVLAPTSTPQLTLITCYPFSFFGHAPKRFIVIAEPDA